MKASKTFSVDPRLAKEAVVKHLKRLNATNKLQFYAQLHEEDIVATIVEIMQDASFPGSLRLQAATQLSVLARGQPKPWVHTGEDLDANAPGNSGIKGTTIENEIAAAQTTARLHEELSRLTAQNVHPTLWPPEVKAIASDLVAYYDKEEGIVDVTP